VFILVHSNAVLPVCLVLLAMEHVQTLLACPSPPPHPLRHQNITFFVSAFVEFDELTDAPLQVRLLHLFLEPVAAEVGEGDQKVHQHADLDLFRRFANHLEDRVDDGRNCLWFLGERLLAPTRMNDVGEHGSGKVETEHVYLGVEASSNQIQHPVDELIFPVDSDQAFLDTALL
jgi:hypothetical protein